MAQEKFGRFWEKARCQRCHLAAHVGCLGEKTPFLLAPHAFRLAFLCTRCQFLHDSPAANPACFACGLTHGLMTRFFTTLKTTVDHQFLHYSCALLNPHAFALKDPATMEILHTPATATSLQVDFGKGPVSKEQILKDGEMEQYFMLDKVGADPNKKLRRMQLLVDEEQLKVGFLDAEPFDPEYCFCGDKSPGVAQCESCLAWVHPGCDGVDEPKRIFASPNPYYCAQCGYLHLLYRNVSFPLLLLEPEQLARADISSTRSVRALTRRRVLSSKTRTWPQPTCLI